MDSTQLRNGCCIYVAVKKPTILFTVIQGINNKVDDDFLGVQRY
jgi:hypothetical protein